MMRGYLPLTAAGILVLLQLPSNGADHADPPVFFLPPCHETNGIAGYLGQPARQGRIDLTAANGFFDRCFIAGGQVPMAPGDEDLIPCGFDYLSGSGLQLPGTARWHLWCRSAGEITLRLCMSVPDDETDYRWIVAANAQSLVLAPAANDGQTAQEQELNFRIDRPGRVLITLDCTKNPPPPKTRIHRITLEGSAINDAKLLRTRWRPAAVHAGFTAPDNCPRPGMWVFETVSMTAAASYSPMTTPFGYFGTSFDGNGRVPAQAGFNFSMWIAGRNATEAPPVNRLPRLIATSLPDAEFSHFGHEGTGVKFRNATAYPFGADRIIQALRADLKDGLWTFYGYYYDEKMQQWRLYASAQQPKLKGPPELPEGEGTLRRTGSFCEIPGPPARERSGDVVRAIKRRGWFYGSDGKWYPALLETSRVRNSSRQPPGKEVHEREEAPVSKRTYYLYSYPSEGWMAMETGGMAYYYPGWSNSDCIEANSPEISLPSYLAPQKTAQLFELPVVFGKSTATEISGGSAAIDYFIEKTAQDSRAVLYYGAVDCLTYTPREIKRGSPVEKDLYRPERTWQHATPEQRVTTGSNRFTLNGLKAGTTYYYRLFVTHPEGKSWDYRSGSFTTPTTGNTEQR